MVAFTIAAMESEKVLPSKPGPTRIHSAFAELEAAIRTDLERAGLLTRGSDPELETLAIAREHKFFPIDRAVIAERVFPLAVPEGKWIRIGFHFEILDVAP